MAEPTRPPRGDDIPDVQNEVSPQVNDPGGSHSKGYSADPTPGGTADSVHV